MIHKEHSDTGQLNTGTVIELRNMRIHTVSNVCIYTPIVGASC